MHSLVVNDTHSTLKIPFQNTRTIYTNGLIVFNRMRQRYPDLIWENFGHFHP